MLITDDIKNYVYNKLFNKIEKKPYPHSVIDNVFPNDFYKQIISNLPNDEKYSQINDKTYNNRLRIWLGHEKMNELCKCNQCESGKNDYKIRKEQFWKEFLNWFMSEDMMNRWIKKYEKYIKKKLPNYNKYKFHMNAVLNRDFINYQIGPHCDSKNKIITMLLYLPETDIYLKWGTSINTPKKTLDIKKLKNGYHDFKLFNEFKTIDFLPNRLFDFGVNKKSWHSVKPIKENFIRNSLQMNICYFHK